MQNPTIMDVVLKLKDIVDTFGLVWKKSPYAVRDYNLKNEKCGLIGVTIDKADFNLSFIFKKKLTFTLHGSLSGYTYGSSLMMLDRQSVSNETYTFLDAHNNHTEELMLLGVHDKDGYNACFELDMDEDKFFQYSTVYDIRMQFEDFKKLQNSGGTFFTPYVNIQYNSGTTLTPDDILDIMRFLEDVSDELIPYATTELERLQRLNA